MNRRRILNTLAVSAVLGGSLVFAGARPADAQVVECRSWQSASAGCGELFFNKTPETEPDAPGSAFVVRPPAVPNHSTAAVVGNQATNPSAASGLGGGDQGAGAATGTAPSGIPSAAVTTAAPGARPNVGGPQAGPSAAAIPQNPPLATGAGAVTGPGVTGRGIANPPGNWNTPNVGTNPSGVGSVGPLPPTAGVTTGANTTTPANTATAGINAVPPAAAAPSDLGAATRVTPPGARANQTTETATTAGNNPACGDLGTNPVTATDSTTASGPSNQPSANAATNIGPNAAPNAATATGSAPTGAPASVTGMGTATTPGGEAASRVTGCDSPQVQPNVTTNQSTTTTDQR